MVEMILINGFVSPARFLFTCKSKCGAPVHKTHTQMSVIMVHMTGSRRRGVGARERQREKEG